MLRDLGVIPAALDTRDIVRLRRDIAPPTDTPATLSYALHTLILARDGATKPLTLTRLDDTTYALIDPDDPATAYPVKRSDLADLPIDMTMLEQGPPLALSGMDAIRAFIAEPLDQLTWNTRHIQSPHILDRATIRARFKNDYPQLTRTLGDETFRLRFPNTMSADDPPGILVWISPTEHHGIPYAVLPALEKLNLIAVGIDNNGNDRPITDRLQNVLDAIHTIRAHIRIDDQRIYTSGLSGGGRCASILFLAFPDLVTGAVPIVGLDSYHRIPTGQPNLYWAGNIGRPAKKLFDRSKEHRLRAITGTMDFNEPEMSRRIAQLQADGFDARLDTIDGMSHTMPTESQFTEALTWVNANQHERAERAAEEAQDQLDKLLESNPTPDPTTDIPTRRTLIDITRTAPWSQPAMKAAHLLGFPD
jgi:dienelactone hydrolase